MSIFEGFRWISTFLAIQGPEIPYFHMQEEVDTVSEPVWCAENNGDSLKVQFWARRVRPGPWMSILGIFWQFSWLFPNFLLLFKYQRPYIARTNEIQYYLYFWKLWRMSQGPIKDSRRALNKHKRKFRRVFGRFGRFWPFWALLFWYITQTQLVLLKYSILM